MRARSFILRCTAFFLLLAFSQKSGAGLLLHNLLHTSQVSKEVPSKQADNKELNFACNCIDDFLMPFAEPNEPVIAAVIEKHETPVTYFTETIPFRKSVLASLRGPPSSIL